MNVLPPLVGNRAPLVHSGWPRARTTVYHRPMAFSSWSRLGAAVVSIAILAMGGMLVACGSSSNTETGDDGGEGVSDASSTSDSSSSVDSATLDAPTSDSGSLSDAPAADALAASDASGPTDSA